MCIPLTTVNLLIRQILQSKFKIQNPEKQQNCDMVIKPSFAEQTISFVVNHSFSKFNDMKYSLNCHIFPTVS